MGVRFRIALLFALLAVLVLSIVCGGIYYFSYSARLKAIKSRLSNRAITSGRMLSQGELFTERLMERIDSSTSISIYKKTVQAYDSRDRKVYDYTDVQGDTIPVNRDILDRARRLSSYFFRYGEKEAIAYHYNNNGQNLVIISAGEDRDGKRSLRQLLNILFLSFLTGSLFFLVSGYIFSARLLRPIEQITKDVEEISAKNLTRRIQSGKARDEWSRLSSTLNDLLDRLQETFEMQRRFISNASHELSTPLASITSQLEVSLQRARTAEEYQQVMHSVHQDVQHMSRLTQTLLQFAKASGNPGGLEIGKVRIDEILMLMPAEMNKINKFYSVALQFGNLPEDEEELLIFGNEPLLFTAIKNIVLNACKYSGNSEARINLEAQKRFVIIHIDDSGLGIPKEEIENIFQPFYRLEEHRAGGFGLGLSLSSRIIKIHKGVIDVVSKPGKGTRFTIQIPTARYMEKEMGKE